MLCTQATGTGQDWRDHTWNMKKQSRRIKTMGLINNLSVCLLINHGKGLCRYLCGMQWEVDFWVYIIM